MVTILPEAWYEHDQLRMMGFEGRELERAVESGELIAKQTKTATWYKGAWILKWLEKPAEVAGK